ncbi:MAG: DUF5305 family protein [Halolamina sp.]
MADWSRVLPGALKCKRFCLRHGWTAVTVLAVFGVVMIGLGAYTGLAPGTETVTEQRGAQTITAESNVSAVVGPKSALWAEGTRLENRPAYLLRDSPNATIDARFRVSNGEFSSVDPTFRLEYRAVRDGETIWSESSPVNATVEQNADRVAATTTVNVSAVAEKIRAREADTRKAASVRATIVLEVPYETDRYDGTLVAKFPVSVDGTAYELDPASASETRTTPVQIERPTEPNVPLVVVLLTLGTLGLLGGGAAYRVTRSPSSEAALLELERRIEHARYAEWISVGEFPTDLSQELVRLENLDDLVNLAVDANGRVIYDRERDAYAVIRRDIVYYVGDRAEVVSEWQFGKVPTQVENES